MHNLPQLPYEMTALEPFISQKTLSFHYEKHHQTYVDNLNKLIQETEFENASLENIIQQSYGHKNWIGIFNNAAQVWNHNFYWHCLVSAKKSHMPDALKQELEKTFGSIENFFQEFKLACLTQFGSGWAWLVLEDNTLKITKTGNADLPMVHGQKALLTCDVWEHAYYLDYQNKRADYVDAILKNIINWNFVWEQFQSS